MARHQFNELLSDTWSDVLAPSHQWQSRQWRVVDSRMPARPVRFSRCGRGMIDFIGVVLHLAVLHLWLGRSFDGSHSSRSAFRRCSRSRNPVNG